MLGPFCTWRFFALGFRARLQRHGVEFTLTLEKHVYLGSSLAFDEGPFLLGSGKLL